MTLDEQREHVHRLVDTAVSYEDFDQLQRAVSLLAFTVRTERVPTSFRPAPTVGNPVCAAPNCQAGWREGLVNVAQAGHDPVWYCSKHRPTQYKTDDEGVTTAFIPVGVLPDPTIALANAKETSRRWLQYLATLELQVNHCASD